MNISMESKENVSYYAIIPANVRYDKNVCPNAKLLYGEITALCNQKGYCWASNSYFSDLYGVSKVSISKWINQLILQGYILSEIKYKEGTKEILNRYLTIVSYPIKEKFNTPIKEKFKDNTTDINNTNNNTNNKDILSCCAEYTKEIIEHLNSVTNSSYKNNSRKTISLISARIKEGFTVNDFKEVIDKKTAEWIKDSKMNKFLRPETLFGTKFEGYLNQKSSTGYTQEGHKVEDYSNIIDF